MGLFGCLAVLKTDQGAGGVRWAGGAECWWVEEQLWIAPRSSCGIIQQEKCSAGGVWRKPKLGGTLGWCGDSRGLCSVLPNSHIGAVPQFP